MECDIDQSLKNPLQTSTELKRVKIETEDAPYTPKYGTKKLTSGDRLNLIVKSQASHGVIGRKTLTNQRHISK